MREIRSKAHFKANMGQIEFVIDLDDIEKKIEEISEKWPSHEGDRVRIILIVGDKGDTIYGHPVIYRGWDEDGTHAI